MKQKIVVLTGAGISAESGIKTFRDSGGLWEGHDVMEVASPQGFRKNPALVLDFYNQRRKQLSEVSPNKAHVALARLETNFDVSIITQNVDDLHERAGSTQVLHLHGELLKVRSSGDASYVRDWETDLLLGQHCPKGYQLRPHIVWFGEEVPALEEAVKRMQKAQIVLVVGTSMQVYPAAGLIDFAPPESPIFFIDPQPKLSVFQYPNLNAIAKTAVAGVPPLVESLMAGLK